MYKSWLFIFLLVLLSQQLYSQEAKKYSFAHYGVSGGLNSNEITRVIQDDDGFMWVGTNNGLQRFDGLRYMNFRHRKNDPASIPDNYIYQILLDKKKNLWVLSGDGKMGILNTKNFIYREVSIKIKDKNILSFDRELVEDEDGNLFLLFHNHEFITWNEKTKEFSADNNFIPIPADWKIVDIIQQPGTKKYWLGRREGLAVYNGQTRQMSYTGRNVEKLRIIDKFGTVPVPNNFLFDNNGRLWFDTWLGTPVIFAYDTRKDEPVLDHFSLMPLIQKYHETKGFLQQKNGTIWIRGLGVFAEWVEKEKQFRPVYNGYQSEQSIAYEMVSDLFEDKEENIWVATRNNGLFRFNPGNQFFTNVRNINRMSGKPGDGSIMSFVQAKQGTILAGSWGDGLYRYDSNFNMVPLNIRGFSEKGTPSMWSMYASRDSNTIWVGAQPGIYAINQATRSSKFYNPAILQDRTIRQIAEDKFGNLWMGTQSLGVFKWTAARGKSKFEDGVASFKGIPNTMLLKIFIDKNGFVWFGTSSTGLYVVDPGTDKVIMHFGTQEPEGRKLLSDGVFSIVQYDDSTIVIGENAIHLFDIKKQKIVKTIQLPESQTANVRSIEKDKNGYLWISLTNGMYRVHPQSKIFVHFDRLDGIANDYFIVAASYTLSNGKILFGADNQLVYFDPSEVHINNPSPDIKITDFKVMNKSLLVDSLLKQEKIVLAPDDNSMTIDFSGLRYDGTYIIKYKLEGLDKDWKMAENTNQAVYSYLPPGDYSFLIKAENAEGKPSENITRLLIRVMPPFWRTWWFLGLVIFVLIGFFFWLDRQRLQKIRATESIRSRIAGSLTEDLSNSLSSINISSELAKTKVDKDPQRTKEYITQISESSNRMMQSMYDMVWSINPRNDTMQHTIYRMKNHAHEIESLYELDIVFDIDKEVTKLELDMEFRYELLSIFKEALDNAGRHAQAKHIHVNLKYKKPKLIMLIEDDGMGFDIDCCGLKRGIADMHRRAAGINASFYIESEIKTGTIIKVVLPVG